jgi:hypothetical protein
MGINEEARTKHSCAHQNICLDGCLVGTSKKLAAFTQNAAHIPLLHSGFLHLFVAVFLRNVSRNLANMTKEQNTIEEQATIIGSAPSIRIEKISKG